MTMLFVEFIADDDELCSDRHLYGPFEDEEAAYAFADKAQRAASKRDIYKNCATIVREVDKPSDFVVEL